MRLGLTIDMEKLDRAKFVGHNPLSTVGTKELLKEDAVVGQSDVLPRMVTYASRHRVRAVRLHG